MGSSQSQRGHEPGFKITGIGFGSLPLSALDVVVMRSKAERQMIEFRDGDGRRSAQPLTRSTVEPFQSAIER
jgi:hypothetical protein